MGSGDLARRVWLGRVVVVFGWLAAIAIAFAIVGETPAGAQSQGGAVADAPLNLRAEPGTWAPIVGQVWQGEHLALLAGPAPGEWYQVQTAEQTGWVYGPLLTLDNGGLGAAGAAGAASAERWVDVDRTSQMVTLYEGDIVLASYWAAMGSDPSDDGFFATAVGTYYVYEKVGRLSWTDWGGAWVDDWVGFDSARLNGFHTYSMDAGGQVLPGGDGPTGGCVALTPQAADHLFAFVSVGTRVEVHR